jgi:glutamate-1-semialdehyde 2,1-aminomutase
VSNYDTARRSDTRRFALFFQEMLRRGILLAPSQFEALFISAAHSDDDLARTAVACRESLDALAAGPA